MTMVGAILIILCCALGLTNFLVDEEIPNQIFQAFDGVLTNKYAFLAFLNVFLLIVGSLMDIFSAIIVVVPLILPLAAEFDIHPIHLAIVFLTNLEIGYITPPVGINLFTQPYLQSYIFEVMLPIKFTKDIKTRLKTIKGQIEGLIRMLDEEHPPEKILVQFKSVSKGLDKAHYLLLLDIQ